MHTSLILYLPENMTKIGCLHLITLMGFWGVWVTKITHLIYEVIRPMFCSYCIYLKGKMFCSFSNASGWRYLGFVTSPFFHQQLSAPSHDNH